MTQLLPFRLGLENYALELTVIQEIVEKQEIFPFPAAPGLVKGAIGFHGRIVPVVSLPQLLGLSAANVCDRLIVLTNVFGPIALAVDQVKAIITVESSAMKPLGHEDGGSYIKDVVSTSEGMINLFDLEKLEGHIEQLCTEHGGLHG